MMYQINEVRGILNGYFKYYRFTLIIKNIMQMRKSYEYN